MDDPATDSISARISDTCPPPTRQVLTAAWAHDLPAIKRLTDEPGRASVQDPVTGETPLHAAIRACGPPPAEAGEDEAYDKAQLEQAKQAIISYKTGETKEMTPQLWQAKKIVDSTLHPGLSCPLKEPEEKVFLGGHRQLT